MPAKCKKCKKLLIKVVKNDKGEQACPECGEVIKGDAIWVDTKDL